MNTVAQHAMEVNICSYKTTVLDEFTANQIEFKTVTLCHGNLFLSMGFGLFCLCLVWVLLGDFINMF